MAIPLGWVGGELIVESLLSGFCKELRCWSLPESLGEWSGEAGCLCKEPCRCEFGFSLEGSIGFTPRFWLLKRDSRASLVDVGPTRLFSDIEFGLVSSLLCVATGSICAVDMEFMLVELTGFGDILLLIIY